MYREDARGWFGEDGEQVGAVTVAESNLGGRRAKLISALQGLVDFTRVNES